MKPRCIVFGSAAAARDVLLVNLLEDFDGRRRLRLGGRPARVRHRPPPSRRRPLGLPGGRRGQLVVVVGELLPPLRRGRRRREGEEEKG